MKKTLWALAGLSTIAIAAPAASQSLNSVDVRVQQLQNQIQTGVQRGTITRTEAQPLREQLRLLRQAERQYSRDGLTRAERQDLQNRIRTLRQQINYAERSGADRYGQSGFIDRNRDGWDDRDYNRDGRLDTAYGQTYAQPGFIDRNRDGWDDRDYNRDGRLDTAYGQTYGQPGFIDRNRDGWDDRDYNRDGRLDTAYGQGGPYEPIQCQERGGIGGVIDDLIGRDNDCGLRVGQVARGNLFGVPYQYRNSFRDGNGVYYRSDGRAIYQIDARSNVVTRVYDVD